MHPKNRMTLLDCVGLGINGIIGTGIFLLPAKVFRNAGGFSWAAWLAIGGVCMLVGLCFCEAAGRADRNGGPYLYARDAFGRWIGVGVGWMALAANLFAYGAVARGFGRNLSFLGGAEGGGAGARREHRAARGGPRRPPTDGVSRWNEECWKAAC